MATMTDQIDVVGVGSPLVDLVLDVDDDFIEAQAGGGKGGMHLVEGDEIERILRACSVEPVCIAGGAAANTTVGCAQLGLKAAFIGSCGRDHLAELYRAHLAEHDCGDWMVEHPEHPTGRVLSLVTPDAQRTMRTCLGAAADVDPSAFTAERFANVRLVMLEGYALFNHQLVFRVIDAAKEAGCAVALDLASFEVVQANRAVIEELLDGRIDLVFANEDEAHAWKSESIHDALDDLGRRASVAVIKIGAEGAWICNGEERHHVAAEDADAVDTTGAGDCWAAGFLAGWLRELPLPCCARMGAMAGAAVVQVHGAQAPLEAWLRIRGYLEAWV